MQFHLGYGGGRQESFGVYVTQTQEASPLIVIISGLESWGKMNVVHQDLRLF